MVRTGESVVVSYRDRWTSSTFHRQCADESEALRWMATVNRDASLRGVSITGLSKRYFCGATGAFYHDRVGKTAEIIK